MKIPAIAFIVLLLFGCVAPVAQTVPFDDAPFQPYVGTGTSTITGSAFMKTQGGDVKVGAGDTVELVPSTPYTAERYEIARRGMPVVPRDPRLAKYVRTTLADAQGNFEFKNIPAGAYFLLCRITWMVPTQFGLMPTGGQASAAVMVKAGDSEKVVLTR
jgi:hypothetical protein